MNNLVQNKPLKKYPNPLDSAIKIMRENLGLWTYHVAKSSAIKAQADRISAIFGVLDTTAGMIVRRQNAAGQNIPYTPIGYRAAWDAFMKTRFQHVIDTHKKFLEDYNDALQKYLTTNPVGKKDAQGKNIGVTQAQADRIGVIGTRVALISARAQSQDWTNPYP